MCGATEKLKEMLGINDDAQQKPSVRNAQDVPLGDGLADSAKLAIQSRRSRISAALGDEA